MIDVCRAAKIHTLATTAVCMREMQCEGMITIAIAGILWLPLFPVFQLSLPLPHMQYMSDWQDLYEKKGDCLQLKLSFQHPIS